MAHLVHATLLSVVAVSTISGQVVPLRQGVEALCALCSCDNNLQLAQCRRRIVDNLNPLTQLALNSDWPDRIAHIRTVTFLDGCPRNIELWRQRFAIVQCPSILQTVRTQHVPSDPGVQQPPIAAALHQAPPATQTIDETTQSADNIALPPLTVRTDVNTIDGSVEFDLRRSTGEYCEVISTCINRTVANKLDESDAFLRAMELVPRVRKCDNTQLNDFVKWNRRLNELMSDKYARLMSCIERDVNDTESDFADCPAGQLPKEYPDECITPQTLSDEILIDYRNNVNVWAETSQWGQTRNLRRQKRQSQRPVQRSV